LKEISSSNYRNLAILVGIISFAFNAVLPSILSYATLPFGSRTYHYAITFTYIGEPLTYIFSNFIPHSSIKVIWILTALAIFPCTYVGINAFLSPYPLLFGTLIGSIMAVASWLLAKMLYAFIIISVISIFRAQGGKSLVHVGNCTQIGSLLGSVFAFSLINFTTIFKQFDPCSD
jgi:riboflavin transporter 2